MRLLLLAVWLFAEIWLLSTITDLLGVWPVVFILLAAAAAGGRVIQRHGLRVMFQSQEAMARGELPTQAVIEGSLGVIAGLLLLVPGLLSDLIALPLLLPPLRRWLAVRGERSLLKRHPELKRPVVIEGEYRQTWNSGSLQPPPD